MKSISIECQHQYSHYLSKFKAFCEESGLVWPLSSKDADPAMADFMDTLYQEGKQASEGEKTLASFEFHFVNHKGRMVRSRRALKGWRKAYPPSSRLPLPRLLMWGMVMQLIYEGYRQMALMTMAAFWMYLRPGEAHELCGKHVVAPARAAGRQYAWTNVVIRDQEGLRPDEVGVFDNSLPFDLPHIRWIGDLLLQCKKDLKSNKDPLFTFTMEEFRNRFSAVGAKFNVKGLHPYQLRHGGATEDLTAKHRDFAGVKSRGRWRTDQSVRRYAKIGRVQQLLQKISPRDIKFCQWAEKNVKKGFCDPLCQSGYHSNVSLIQCFAGKLATLWECLGDPCPAPSLIQYASPITCKEGPEVPHEGTCTPSCSDGYEATETALNCLTGFLIPPRFDCIALNCTSIHWIPGAVMPLPGYNLTVLRPGSDPDIVWVPQESRTCEEGPSISSGGTCTANCQPGYLPDIPHLQCQIGNLSPPTYSCIGQPCVPPNDVPDAPAVPCVEGPLISHGSNCTLTCDLGFVPSISTMMCNATELHPSNFSCIGLPCSYPTGIPNAASPACLEPLENLTHGSACTTQCLAGYVPTEPFLYCYGSLMRPSSFQCLPSSTYVDYQAPGSQIAKAWSKNMATAPLTDGFVLACHKDDFSQSMHCASILSAATLLRQGDRSSVTGVDVEIFVMQPLGPNKVMACYKLESGSTSCRSLELSGSSLVQSPEVTLNTGDTYHLALTRLSDTKSVLCFQRGLSTWICRVLIAGSSISLGTEFSVTGTLSGLAVTSPSDSQVVVCAALSDQYRATTCYLLSVSNTNSLDLVNSSLVNRTWK
eukprot:symbB.v1.2.016746.t1/scaffold1277.1/size127245/10